MALGAQCRVQLTHRGLQVQHIIGVGATLCPPTPQLHARAPWQTAAAATPPSAFPTPSPATPKRRAPTDELAHAKMEIGARQLRSWRANLVFGARQMQRVMCDV